MKITLIGDSIREQYSGKVKEILGDGYEIWSPGENCRFAKYTLRGLFDWSRYMDGSSVVHFNCGLWDMCNLFGDGSFSTEDEYIANMMRIADILTARYKTVIFATTTPAKETNKFYDKGVVERFNSIIVPRFKEKGIIINDLYGIVSSDTDRYIREDGVHLSEDGIEAVGSAVAELIRSFDSDSTIESGGTEDQDTTGAPVII